MRLPSSDCKQRRHISLNAKLSLQDIHDRISSTDECLDMPYRRNLTTLYLVQSMREFSRRKIKSNDRDYVFGATDMTARWIAHVPNYEEATASRLLQVLQQDFFLVGVTERIDEFLLLLASAYNPLESK